MAQILTLNPNGKAVPRQPTPEEVAAGCVTRIARALHDLMVKGAKNYLKGNPAIPETWDEVVAQPHVQKAWAETAVQVAVSVLNELSQGLPLRPIPYESAVRDHERSRLMRWAALEQRRLREAGDEAGALAVSGICAIIATKPIIPNGQED